MINIFLRIIRWAFTIETPSSFIEVKHLQYDVTDGAITPSEYLSRIRTIQMNSFSL